VQLPASSNGFVLLVSSVCSVQFPPDRVSTTSAARSAYQTACEDGLLPLCGLRTIDDRNPVYCRRRFSSPRSTDFLIVVVVGGGIHV